MCSEGSEPYKPSCVGGWSCGNGKKGLLSTEGRIPKSTRQMSCSLGLHLCICLSNPVNKEEKHNRERKRKISSDRSETQSEQPVLVSPLAAAVPASPAHMVPRNARQAPPLPRSRRANWHPCPPACSLEIPQGETIAAVTGMSRLSLSSL